VCRGCSLLFCGDGGLRDPNNRLLFFVASKQGYRQKQGQGGESAGVCVLNHPLRIAGE